MAIENAERISNCRKAGKGFIYKARHMQNISTNVKTRTSSMLCQIQPVERCKSKEITVLQTAERKKHTRYQQPKKIAASGRGRKISTTYDVNEWHCKQ